MGAAGWIRRGSLHDFVRFWDDFGTSVYLFFDYKKLDISFFLACFQVIFVSISESKFRRLGLQNQGLRIESNAKHAVSWESFLITFGIDFYHLLEALGAAFLVFGL